jgi:hypothetical protein
LELVVQGLLPNLDVTDLTQLIMEGRYRVHHGPIERFPEFLRPDDGALSSIEKLKDWRDFHFAFRDATGRYHQRKPGDRSVTACYDKGYLVVSHGIHGLSASAAGWLEDCAHMLNIPKNYLWLNSWAIKGASGIDWHFDYEDVIHFQIKGDKLLKLMRTPKTIGADRQLKTFERTLMAGENFDDAHEEIVTAGTITIIPRGVWHWSEAKSDESFAVSLCMGLPSRAEILSKALFKRLRLVEQNRMPLLGSNSSQIDAMQSLLDESAPLLRAMNGLSVVSEENRSEITAEIVNTSYFYLGLRANASLDPLRLLVDGQAIAIPSEDSTRDIVRAACTLGYGFFPSDLAKLVPRANPDLINEILSSLTKAGFLDFIHMA